MPRYSSSDQLSSQASALTLEWRGCSTNIGDSFFGERCEALFWLLLRTTKVSAGIRISLALKKDIAVYRVNFAVALEAIRCCQTFQGGRFA